MERYPTKKELNNIKNWKLRTSTKDKYSHILLINYIKNIWWQPEWGFKLTGKKVLKLQLHTGGWSGNEEIINALQKNYLFWVLYWEQSHRGGHYYFIIRTYK